MRGLGAADVDLVDLLGMGAHPLSQGEPVHVAELRMLFR